MRIGITGAAGTIGSVLMRYLGERYEVVGIDRNDTPDVIPLDMVKEPERIAEVFKGVDVIVHLAWDTREAGAALSPVLPENKTMAETVLDAAYHRKIPRVILASSVHAAFGFVFAAPGGWSDDRRTGAFIDGPETHARLHRAPRVRVADGFYPLGVYGASKVYMEALGSAYAARGLRVIAVRFGNVRRDDSHGEYPFWLSHRDCGQFIERCMSVEDAPPLLTLFAVSDNTRNPFDINDARAMLGYDPQDGAPCPYGMKRVCKGG